MFFLSLCSFSPLFGKCQIMKRFLSVLFIVGCSVFFANWAMAENNPELENTCDIEVAFEYEVEDLSVKFVNASIGEYDIVEWEFGDGERKSTEQDPEHEYPDEGEYEFCLTVTNSQTGCTERFCGQLYVFK